MVLTGLGTTGPASSQVTGQASVVKRGKVRTFGYPVSRTFMLDGFQVQIFQREVVQLQPNGGVQTLNLLDPGLMPDTTRLTLQLSAWPRPAPSRPASAALLFPATRPPGVIIAIGARRAFPARATPLP